MGLGFRGLGFRGLGLRGLGFRGLGFRILNAWTLKICRIVAHCTMFRSFEPSFCLFLGPGSAEHC